MGSRLTKDVENLTGLLRGCDHDDPALALLVVIAQELRQLREHMTEPWQLTETPETPGVQNCVAAEPDQPAAAGLDQTPESIGLQIYPHYGGYVVARDGVGWVGGRYATPEDAATAGITYGKSPRPLP